MVQKTVCKNPECSNEILESTAERTGGYCMPCVQKVARAEREKFIRENRKDLNEFDGVTDPVEVLKIIHRPRKPDPLVNWIPYPTPTDQIYLGLSAAELVRMADYAESLIGTDRPEEAERIVGALASFTNANLDGCLRRLVANDHFYPSYLFRTAPPDICNELLALVEKDQANRNLILSALAWIGDDKVVKRFADWRDKPPRWQLAGGWMGANGRRKAAESRLFSLLGPLSWSIECPSAVSGYYTAI